MWASLAPPTAVDDEDDSLGSVTAGEFNKIHVILFTSSDTEKRCFVSHLATTWLLLFIMCVFISGVIISLNLKYKVAFKIKKSVFFF